MIELHNMDCMEYLKTCKDNEFDLAIVDPPYFDGPNKSNFYRNGEKSKTGAPAGKYSTIEEWSVPNSDYFNELRRVSKHQIIWGCNYYAKEIDSVGRIVWDKKNGESTFSDGEIASCSLIDSVRFFRYRWNGMLQENMKNKEHRIHPTQKPVALYEWILSTYAKPEMKILDTHLGSGSSAIAAHYFGCDFVGIELDEDYFKAAKERIEQQTSQISLF